MAWVALALHAALLAAAAPALLGLMGWAAARRRGEPPPPPQQAWRDLVRLWRKGATAPAGSSVVFAAAPAVSLAAASLAGLLVPTFALGTATAPAADLIVVAGLLIVSRAALALAAHDTGSPAEAFLSTRIMAARLGAGPVLLLVALDMLLLSGTTNLDATAAAVRDGGAGARLGGALAGAALFLMALTEGAAPIAAFSGRRRAVATVAGQVRLFAALSAALAVTAPYGIAPAGAGVFAWVGGAVCWAAKLGILASIAEAIGPWRPALSVAALLALIAVALGGVQGAA